MLFLIFMVFPEPDLAKACLQNSFWKNNENQEKKVKIA